MLADVAASCSTPPTRKSQRLQHRQHPTTELVAKPRSRARERERDPNRRCCFLLSRCPASSPAGMPLLARRNALCWLCCLKCARAPPQRAHGWEAGSRVSSDLKATLLSTLSGLKHKGHTGLRTQLKQERGAAVSQFSSPDPMLFAPERKSLSVCGPLQPARLVAAVAR